MIQMTEHRIDLEALARSLSGGAHSIYGASSSPMYLNCAGSLIPNILAKDDAGYDAAYGTVAHYITETWLREGDAPKRLLGTNQFIETEEWGHLVWIDEEMFGYAEQCVDRCEWLPGEHLIERRVFFSHLTPIPNQGGTLDFAAMERRRAVVIDHKFGASPENMVLAEENPQLMLYAIGLMRDPEFEHYGFKDFIIRINQPRLDHFDEWHTTRSRLIDFEDYARERMLAAWQWNAPRTPGAKQCRFCKVKASCAAYAKTLDDLTGAVFGDTTQTAEDMREFVERLDDEHSPFAMKVRPIGELSVAQMAKLLPFRGTVESWFKSIEAALQAVAKHGEKVPGMKVVEGRSRRQYIDPVKARDGLIQLGLKEDQIAKVTMVSPNQAEQLLRKKGMPGKDIKDAMKALVVKPPGKAILVPSTDRRPEVEDVTALVFEDVENHETQEEL